MKPPCTAFVSDASPRRHEVGVRRVERDELLRSSTGSCCRTSVQKPAPVFWPSSVATGASTCGDRTPPSALPCASRASTTGEVDTTSSDAADRWRDCRCAPTRRGGGTRLGGASGADRRSSACAQPTQGGLRMKSNIWIAPCAVADVVEADDHRVRVGVRGAGHLPRSEHRGVGLAGAEVRCRSRRPRPRRRTRARRGRCGSAAATGPGRRGSGACVSGEPPRAAAVHHEAVVDVRERLHRVDVGDEPARRLRLAGRDQALRLRARRARSRTSGGCRVPACVKMSYE